MPTRMARGTGSFVSMMNRRLARTRRDALGPPATASAEPPGECALSPFERNFRDARDEGLALVPGIGEMDALGRGRLLGNRKPVPPFGCRADRPWREAATAIRAEIEKHAIGAIRTERTFKGADARIQRGGGKIFVAIFAIRAKFQCHSVTSFRYECNDRLFGSVDCVRVKPWRPHLEPSLCNFPVLDLVDGNHV